MRIHGVVRNAWFKIGVLRSKRSFLVVDMPSIDIVLGMDFCHDHDVKVSFRKRVVDAMHRAKGKSMNVRLHEFRKRGIASAGIKSDTIELCSLDAFARTIDRKSHDDVDDAFVECLSSTQLSRSNQSTRCHRAKVHCIRKWRR